MFRMQLASRPWEPRQAEPKTGIDGQIHREIVERWHLGTLRNTLNTAQLRGCYCEWQAVSGEGKFWINPAHRLRPSRGEKQGVVLVGAYKPDWSVVRPKWERPCFKKHLFSSRCLWSPSLGQSTLTLKKEPSLQTCHKTKVKKLANLKESTNKAKRVKYCGRAGQVGLNGSNSLTFLQCVFQCVSSKSKHSEKC